MRPLHTLAVGAYRLSSSVLNAGAILCYHALRGPGYPSSGVVNIPVELLHETLSLVAQTCTPIHTSEFLDRYATGRSLRRCVAVTFDDAYHSVLTLGAGILRDLGVPATVFVVNDAAATGGRFWWDRIDDIYPLCTPARWRQFEQDIGLPQEYRDGQPGILGPLRPVRQWILKGHLGRTTPVLATALARLESDCGEASRQRSMTYSELRDLHSAADVEFGIHTVSHPVLPLCSDEELRIELRHSHELLAEQLPGVRRVFAVPFGLYDQRVLDFARESGFSHSLTLSGTGTRARGVGGPVPRVAASEFHSPERMLLRSGVTARMPVPFPELPGPSS